MSFLRNENQQQLNKFQPDSEQQLSDHHDAYLQILTVMWSLNLFGVPKCVFFLIMIIGLITIQKNHGLFRDGKQPQDSKHVLSSRGKQMPKNGSFF